MQCEMCGREGEIVGAIVEGTMLKVCSNCAKFGNVVEVKKPVVREEVKRVVPIKHVEIVEIVVDDYSLKVKNAREKFDLKQEELAKQIAEKESVIHKVETGGLKPSLKLAKKLEQFLKIKLIESYTEEKKKNLDFRDSDLTIGDLLRMKKK
ncbi:MAG: TIGR00270 family protein [Nanoarchaeota archaeon]|nr:TIGR00270 family protein [Nanoarchaeota archaeon]